jgi:hypothetical protein
MEKARNEKIKEVLLAGFVIVCVALIFMVWFDAMSNNGAENPYFYRGEPEENTAFYATRTADPEATLMGTGTIAPEEAEHQKQTPTPPPIPTQPITPESDN